MDVLEEGPNENDSNYSNRSVQKHLKHVNKIHDYLSAVVNERMGQSEASSHQGMLTFPYVLNL